MRIVARKNVTEKKVIASFALATFKSGYIADDSIAVQSTTVNHFSWNLSVGQHLSRLLKEFVI